MNKHQIEKDIERLVGSEDVVVKQHGANIKIEWSHKPLTFSQLAEIAEMFGTDAIDINSGQDVDSWCSAGFDFVELTVRGVDLD